MGGEKKTPLTTWLYGACESKKGKPVKKIKGPPQTKFPHILYTIYSLAYEINFLNQAF